MLMDCHKPEHQSAIAPSDLSGHLYTQHRLLNPNYIPDWFCVQNQSGGPLIGSLTRDLARLAFPTFRFDPQYQRPQLAIHSSYEQTLLQTVPAYSNRRLEFRVASHCLAPSLAGSAATGAQR